MSIAILETARLRLRPLTLEDAPIVQQLAGDSRIAQNMMDSFPHPYPVQAALDWIASHEPQAVTLEGFVWAVTLRKSGELIGCVELSGRSAGGMGLGYWISVPYWNQGYASEAVRAVIEFGFAELEERRIHAQHYARNPASGAVMRKAGMKLVGTMRQAALKNGQVEDDVFYEILSTDPPPENRRSPSLETPRLLLRPWAMGDAPTFARLSDDPAIAANTGTFLHPQPDGWAHKRIARYLESSRVSTGYSFAVCLRDSLEVIGECGITTEARHRRGELGYWCGAAHRGNGYITEAARAVMSFGFETLGLNRIQASYFPRNPASGRILEKLGMKPEGLLRGYYVKNGVPEDVFYYAALIADRPNPSESIATTLEQSEVSL